VAILSIREVTKRYANHTALDSVSIEMPENSIFGLLGPNGAGKTTLIRIINQITAPDHGEILLSGEKLNPKHTSIIGYLPEERGLYKKMKVGEQALYFAMLKGLSKQEALKQLKFWFERFEIQAWWNRKVEELSKGMQQKVQFIVTIIHKPRLLIFDEPFSGFDPINVNILKEEILNLRKNGSSIIFSTHNMASVEELCDNIALINKSKKILDGNVKEIKKSFSTNTYRTVLTELSQPLDSFMPDEFKIKDIIQDETAITATINLPSGVSSNELIKVLLPCSVIHSFNEIMPTMNDIFISQVQNNDKNGNDILLNNYN